jgi:hypothetical protein
MTSKETGNFTVYSLNFNLITFNLGEMAAKNAKVFTGIMNGTVTSNLVYTDTDKNIQSENALVGLTGFKISHSNITFSTNVTSLTSINITSVVVYNYL